MGQVWEQWERPGENGTGLGTVGQAWGQWDRGICQAEQPNPTPKEFREASTELPALRRHVGMAEGEEEEKEDEDPEGVPYFSSSASGRQGGHRSGTG